MLSLDEESHYWRSSLPVANPLNLVPLTAMPDDNPVAWVKTYGANDARVFYTNLGHSMATWERSDFRSHLLAGIQWVSEGRPDRTCTEGI